MNKLKHAVLLIVALALFADAFDTTITFSSGRQYGMFTMDGRSNIASGIRTDVPDTVRFGLGLTIYRVRNNGQFCTLACGSAAPTAIAFHVDSGSAGFRNDSDIVWNEALTFPNQLKSLDSINDVVMTPCFGGGPYGLGFLVSSDYSSSVWSGCGNVTTFQSLKKHNRIVYYRKGDVFLKVQVAGFDSISEPCDFVNPPMSCSWGDKVLFRYVMTDDSTGFFGTDVISIRNPVKSVRSSRGSAVSAWKSDLYRMILGRRPLDGEKR